jgi:hypothetical protein
VIRLEMPGIIFGTILIVGIIDVIIFGIRVLGKNTPTNAPLLICSTLHTRCFLVRHFIHVFFSIRLFDIIEKIDTTFFSIDKWSIFSVRTDDYLGNPLDCHSLHEKLNWNLMRHAHPNLTLPIQWILVFQFNDCENAHHAEIPGMHVQSANDI